MFAVTFNAIIRYFVIPAVSILLLQRTLLDLPTATLIVNLVLTVLLVPMLIWHFLKLIPNLALLRKMHFLRNLWEIILELLTLVGFWMFYLSLPR